MRYWWGRWGWPTGHKGRPGTGLFQASPRNRDQTGWREGHSGWRAGHTGRPDTELPVASSRIEDHPGWWEPRDWGRRAERAYRVRCEPGRCVRREGRTRRGYSN